MRIALHQKIALTLAFGIFLVMGLSAMALKSSLHSFFLQRFHREIQREIILAARLVSEQARPPTAFDAQTVADTLSRLLGRRVILWNAQGRRWADSLSSSAGRDVVDENVLGRPEIGQAQQKGWGLAVRFSLEDQATQIFAAAPFSSGKYNGFVQMLIPYEEIKGIEKPLAGFLFKGLGAAVVCGLLIVYLSARHVTQPLRRMAETLKALAREEKVGPIRVATNDEVADCAEAVNALEEAWEKRKEEVSRNQAWFRAVLLSLMDGLMVLGQDGRIQLMNESLRQMLGLTENPVGRYPLEVIRNAELQILVDQIVHKRQSRLTQEIKFVFPEDRIVDVHAAVITRDGRLEGSVWVFHDITHLRRLENVRQDFVANVSHELRTPVAAIQGYAETLLEGALDDKDNARDFLQIIASDARRLSQLISDLLDLSRIESGRMEWKRQPCSLFDILKGRVPLLLKEAEKNHCRLIINVSPDTPPVMGDASALSQVVFNLVDNAIKYNRPGGEVELTVEEEGDSVVWIVRDTGVGIPPADRPRIFERFYRVDKARSRDLGGTGLGLAIVKHIVQAHQGHIEVVSHWGEGTTMRVCLPKAKPTV